MSAGRGAQRRECGERERKEGGKAERKGEECT